MKDGADSTLKFGDESPLFDGPHPGGDLPPYLTISPPINRRVDALWARASSTDQLGSTLMARATTRATVTSEIAACSIMVNLAHRDSGIVSVGLNAVELVNDT